MTLVATFAPTFILSFYSHHEQQKQLCKTIGSHIRKCYRLMSEYYCVMTSSPQSNLRRNLLRDPPRLLQSLMNYRIHFFNVYHRQTWHGYIYPLPRHRVRMDCSRTTVLMATDFRYGVLTNLSSYMEPHPS